MNGRRIISWLVICAALLALAALTVVFTTCGGGAGRSKTPGMPKAVSPDMGVNEWIHTWGTSDPGDVSAVALDESEGVYVTAYTWKPGAYSGDTILLKYDTDGNRMWQKSWDCYDYDQANDLAVDGDGDVYVVGEIRNVSRDDRLNAALILKYSSSGNLLWQRVWTGGGIDYANAVAIDSTEDIYVAGRTTCGEPRGHKVLLLKYSPTGNLLWQKSWSERDVFEADDLAVDDSGNIYIVGEYHGLHSPGGTDIFVLKYDSSGSLLWQKTWGGHGLEMPRAVAADAGGNVYITGRTQEYGLARVDVFLLKYDSQGSLEWQRVWSGTDHYWVHTVSIDIDGNAYLAGNIREFSSGSRRIDPSRQWERYPWGDIFLLKWSPTGNLVWCRRWVGDRMTSVEGVAVDGNGKVYLAGGAGNTLGSWQSVDGDISTPPGWETPLDGTEGVLEGTETFPEGTETEPEGIIDEGGILIMKYDPS